MGKKDDGMRDVGCGYIIIVLIICTYAADVIIEIAALYAN